ncbi:LysM peptidoglycan-binding domain-containing protein [Thermorudis peleae]|uniref:LysM peptidoglycan-binding domain-containing protein n=1 Tax=Thermorudis peleae TaxID=1382356 RepID=UPI00068F8981|nr:LysM domain-containing protein [Thermorudis peleae]
MMPIRQVAALLSCVAAMVLASCSWPVHTSKPTPTAVPTPTPIPVLEVVTPTPGPALPPAGTPTPRPGGTPAAGTYVVQPGDSLFTIAARFHVSAQDLAAANHLTDPNTIQVGQVLIIPTPSSR